MIERRVTRELVIGPRRRTESESAKKREFPGPNLSIVPPSFGQTAVKSGAGTWSIWRRFAGRALCLDIGLITGAPMHSTLKPKQTDDPHDFVVVAPEAARVAPDPVRVAPDPARVVPDPVAVAPADVAR